MIIKTQETYRCEYCRKLYVVKKAAVKHEKYCKNNPANMHMCFQYCQHLERTREIEEQAYGNLEYTEFTCKATGNTMWSYIAERRELQPTSDERMPLKCEHYRGPDYYAGLNDLGEMII